MIILPTLLLIVIFGIFMGLSNFLIKKRDYEHILPRTLFYLLGIAILYIYLTNLVDILEIQDILQPSISLFNLAVFCSVVALNTLLYRTMMQYTITRRSNIPSMFLAPRKNFIFTKYIEVLFQQAVFISVIVVFASGLGISNLQISLLMALIMCLLHLPLFFFTSTRDAMVVLIGATIGGFVGTILVLHFENGFYYTLLIHIAFYTSVLASLGKYHRELHQLKKEVLNSKKTI